MAMAEEKNSVESTYDGQADIYSQFVTTPLGTLEKQLFDLSIKDSDGLKVLDLGGGTGLRSRDALKAGAAAVDLVDISLEMMRQGQEYERSIRRNTINWYKGDISKPLDHLPLGSYDMVIANGIFDHAISREGLEAMWHNAAAYLKPGGRLVANRNNPRSSAAAHGKYGVLFSDFHDVPGGLGFRYNILTNPPLSFDLTPVETYYTGSLEVPAKYFTDFQNVPFEETPVVQSDPEFWRQYLDDPILYIFTARKHP